MLSLSLLSCGAETDNVVGTWQADRASVVTLQFYPDGVAALSSLGVLGLRWTRTASNEFRIEALGESLYFNFRLAEDAVGPFGTLELAGYEALVFRKLE
jgi:hypothetical protein